MKSKGIGFNSLKRFKGDDPVGELCFDVLDLGESINGRAGLTGTLSNAKVKIDINSNNLNRSKLGVVRTMIHELIHAELHAMVLEAGYYNNLEEFANSYVGDDPFLMIWEYYTNYGISDFQHEFMADNYIESMSKSLRDIYSDVRSDAFHNYVDGSTFYIGAEVNAWNWDDFFRAIAWQGLAGTNSYDLLDEQLKRKYEFYAKELREVEVESAKCS